MANKTKGSAGLGIAKGAKDGFYVPVHEDGGPITCKYLHELEAAIRARTPIAGIGMTANKFDGGVTISAKNLIKLNVCVNGEPKEFHFYSLEKDPNLT